MTWRTREQQWSVQFSTLHTYQTDLGICALHLQIADICNYVIIFSIYTSFILKDENSDNINSW